VVAPESSPTRQGISRSRAIALQVAVFVIALIPMSTALGKRVHGHFYFRQAHVMANIEKYLEDGLSLHPETYNQDVPYSLFDFPAYELLVAAFVKLVGGDPLVVSRLFSLLCFAATFLLIDRLLASTGLPPATALMVVFLFAISPLCLFYFVTPLVDVLAIPLSLASLYAFVRYRSASSRRGWFWLMTGAGVFATLIKNPVYLPVFCAIVLFGVVRSGPKFLLERDTIGFGAAVLASVVLFKLYSNRVNGIAGFLSSSESTAYFGPLEDRLDPRSWRRILRVEQEEMLNSVTWVLAIGGLVLYAVRSRSEFKSLYLGLVSGALLALLIFFSRYTWHDYYQLPMELPLAFCAAYGLQSIADGSSWLAARNRRNPWMGRGFALLVPAVLGLSLYEGWTGFRDVASTPTDWIERNGEWIQERTSADDFVVYVLDTADRRDWNPVFLYFAKRDGYNLSHKRVSPRVLSSIRARFGTKYRRIVLFCPLKLRNELRSRLESAGAAPVDVGPPGYLYRLDGEVGVPSPTARSSRAPSS
jgi:Dolichyl-phosphate-mannose-protein mannosyltransferase